MRPISLALLIVLSLACSKKVDDAEPKAKAKEKTAKSADVDPDDDAPFHFENTESGDALDDALREQALVPRGGPVTRQPQRGFHNPLHAATALLRPNTANRQLDDFCAGFERL